MGTDLELAGGTARTGTVVVVGGGGSDVEASLIVTAEHTDSEDLPGRVDVFDALEAVIGGTLAALSARVTQRNVSTTPAAGTYSLNEYIDINLADRTQDEIDAVQAFLVSRGYSVTTGAPPTPPAPPVFTSIVLAPASASIAPTATQQLTETLLDQYLATYTGTAPSRTMASSDNTKATVNSSMLVTGVAQGTANITSTRGLIVSNNAVITVTSGVPDTMIELIATLTGTDSAVPAAYDVRVGVEQTFDLGGGVWECGKWDDARGSTGFGPSLTQGTNINRPHWTPASFLLAFDGSNDLLVTAASALFDLSGAKSMVLIANPNNVASKYMMNIEGSGRALYMAKDATGKIDAEANQGGFPQAISTVLGSSNTRVIIASKNAATDVSIDVPNTTRVSAVAGGAQASGNNTLAVGSLANGTVSTLMNVRAVMVLSRQATADDITKITAWAVARHSAVVA